MTKPKWEKEMEKYIHGMTDDDFQNFLVETDYEFYKNVKTPLTGIPELDALENDPLLAFTANSSLGRFHIENATLDESLAWLSISWSEKKDVGSLLPSSAGKADVWMVLPDTSMITCYDIKRLIVEDDEYIYKLAA